MKAIFINFLTVLAYAMLIIICAFAASNLAINIYVFFNPIIERDMQAGFVILLIGSWVFLLSIVAGAILVAYRKNTDCLEGKL